MYKVIFYFVFIIFFALIMYIFINYCVNTHLVSKRHEYESMTHNSINISEYEAIKIKCVHEHNSIENDFATQYPI